MNMKSKILILFGCLFFLVISSIEAMDVEPPLPELSQAVADNRCLKVQKLLNDGANPWQRDSRGETVFHKVARTGNLGIARLLMEKHGDAFCSQTETHFPPGSGPLPWMVAQEHKNSGISILFCNYHRSQSPLFKALMLGDLELLKKSITLENVNAPIEGSTPLHWAVYLEDKKLIQKLLQRGADPTVKVYGLNAYDSAFDNIKLVMEIFSNRGGRETEAPELVFTKHARDRMAERNISEQDIERVIRMDNRFKDLKYPGSIVYREQSKKSSHQLVVVVKPKNIVITTYLSETW